VDTWPADVDDRRARVDWGHSPRHGLREAVRDYLWCSWTRTGDPPAEKKKFLANLEALEWAPRASDRDREWMWGQVLQEFRNWAGRYRGMSKRKEGKLTDADLAVIQDIEKTFKQLGEIEKTGAPEKAPNEVCKQLAKFAAALRGKNQPETRAAWGQVFFIMKHQVGKRPPFCEALLRYLMSTGTFDEQMQCLEAYAAPVEGGEVTRRCQQLVEAAGQSQPWSQLHNIAPQDKDKAQRIAEFFGKQTLRLADKGLFSPWCLYMARAARRVQRQVGEVGGNEVLEGLLAKRLLLNHPWRPDARVRSGAVSYMWIVHFDYPGLHGKLPPASAFDDLYVEEAKRTGLLDPGYWHIGRDTAGKIVKVAAELLAPSDDSPLGFGKAKGVCAGRDEYLMWTDRILNGPAEVRNAFVAKIAAAYGTKRFDHVAMGYAYFLGSPNVAANDGRKEFFAKLGSYLEKARGAGYRPPLPPLSVLSRFEDPERLALSAPETDVLLGIFAFAAPARWDGGQGHEALARTLCANLPAQQREARLFAVIPQIWRMARDLRDGNFRDQLGVIARQLFAKKQNELALAHAQAGLELFGAGLPTDLATTFASIRTHTIGTTGIPVGMNRNDPRYPLFMAQAALAAGNAEGALELVSPHLDKLVENVKEFDPEFTLWLVSREIETLNHENAEKLVRAMRGWLERPGAAVDPEIRARVDLAAANVAFGRRAFPLAKASYDKILATKDYEGTRAALEAQIRIADVDRVTKQYDQAISRLEKLGKRQSRYLQVEAPLHLAMVKYDQEEYREAMNCLEQVFALSPNHAEARILEGNVFLKLKKLEQATVVKLGISASQRVIVPGKPLRVSLEDRNLAIVGKSSNIQIRAWTDSGDEELFLLLPFGDSKTRFQGQLATAMGALAKHDGTLQVLGRDVIHYDFSPEFRAAHGLTTGEPATLTVATDAELYASYGRIMSKKEFEEEAMERMLAAKLQIDEKAAPGPGQALSAVRTGNQVKPGNPINVRVVDMDRNISPERDKLPVRVVAPGSGFEFLLHFRRFPFIAGENWTTVAMGKKDGAFQAMVPGQPQGSGAGEGAASAGAACWWALAATSSKASASRSSMVIASWGHSPRQAPRPSQ
jgi:tetratricopeptide (TPR) repeat protein